VGAAGKTQPRQERDEMPPGVAGGAAGKMPQPRQEREGAAGEADDQSA